MLERAVRRAENWFQEIGEQIVLRSIAVTAEKQGQDLLDWLPTRLRLTAK